MTILKVVWKQKIWLVVFLLVILGVALLFAQDSEPQPVSILPTEQVSTGQVCMCRFQYADDAQRRMLYVESWQGGERAWQLPLVAVEKTGIYSVQVAFTLGEKLMWSASWDDQAAVLESPRPSGVVYGSLTQEALENWEGDTDLILLALGFGDLEEGLPVIDCLTLMNSTEYFANYQEVQLLRLACGQESCTHED